MPGAAQINTTTIELIPRLGGSIIAKGNLNYYNGTIGQANFIGLEIGFVYSTSFINITTVSSSQDNIVTVSGETIQRIVYSNTYPGGSTAADIDYSMKINDWLGDPLLQNTTYHVRSYVKSQATGYYKYGANISTITLIGDKGYYMSDTTVGFYDPLQIRDTNEGVDKVLTVNSSGLATWKPIKSLFTFGHYIGELYGGGIVVAVWKEADDEKVLISSLEDISYSEPTNFSYGTGPTGGFDNIVRPVVVQPDGKILVGGLFTSYNGVTANRIIRLNPDGSIDNSFVAGGGFEATVWEIKLQSDGKILVAGDFITYNGTTVNRIVRLNANGSIDTSFVTGTGFNSGSVRALTIQTDGKILVGGSFTSYNVTTATRIIRLNTNGSVDTSFVTGSGFNDTVYSIVEQSDGTILVGGSFVTYNVTTNVGRIIKLNSTGSPTTFATGNTNGSRFNNAVLSIAVQPDGKILVCGTFTNYTWMGGAGVITNAPRVIRLESNGDVDFTFVINAGFTQNVDVSQIILQPNGKVLIGGGFTTYSGVTKNRIIRLNSNGSIDTSFIPTSIGFNNTVWYITLNKGRIFVSGQFTTYNGNTANRFYIINEKIESWSIGAANTTLIGTSAQSKYNGYLNTLASNAQSDALGITMSVALLASSYRGGGYDDWYLPSYFELNQIFNQAAIVNKVLGKESLEFFDIDYWSSTEYGPTSSITSSMLNNVFGSSIKGGYTVKSKSDSARVRLVRKESIYTGDGLILNLDATNKKSFSDIEYLNIGDVTKWKDLVNGGLTSSYSFNLSSYQAIVDSDFPLTYYGPVYYPQESGFLRFDRKSIGSFSTGFIQVGSYVDFKAPVGNTTTVTVETWVRLRPNFAGGMIFGWDKYDVYCSGGRLGFNTNNSDLYGISDVNVTNLKLLGNWVHYVFEMKVGSEIGATPSFLSNNKIYINGNEQILSQQPTISPTPGPTSSNISFNSGLGRIGGWRASDSYFINMDMSVFRVYNRALTKDEIMKNYSTEKKRYEILPALLTNNLLFHIDFDNTLSYSGDGTTSGVVTDLTGSGRTATLTISGTTVKPAVIKTSTLYNGKEIIFSGTTVLNPSLFLANSTPFQNIINLSISIWIKVQEYKNGEIILRWDSTDNGVGPWQVFQTSSNIAFRLRSSTYETRVGTKKLTLNKWTHVCATYNNVTKKMKTYIDGILDIDSFVPNTFSFPTTRIGDIFIGQYPDTVSGERYPLNGSIANIQIYNKELSYGEVKNNYDTDKFRFDNFSDANKFYSHEINGNPTFSISQNLSLDFGTASNDKIVSMNLSGYSKTVDKTKLFTRPTNYRYIGELYGGGIIVAMWYYPKTIFNYLIMSLEDISGPVAWSNVTNVVSGATSDFDGKSNTATIIAQSGHASSAAKLCDDYAGGGFTDWYLPSAFEMNQAYNAGSIIDTVLGSDLLTGSYWTSTESSFSTAYKYTFTPTYNLSPFIDERPAFGYQTILTKSPVLTSRPKVRAFRLATNAVEVPVWDPVWDEGYTPWNGTETAFLPGIYDSTDFDYWRRRNLKTGAITVILGNTFTVGAGFTITGNRITIWENVLEFGICWTLGSGFIAPPIPTINDNKVVGTGSYNVFNSTITTSFSMFNYSVRVRVYATTSSGTYYGDLIMTGSNYE